MEQKPAKITAVFLPRTMGIFILLIILLSFTAGTIKREMVLTLTGAVFLALWLYCLAMTLILALFQRRRAARVSISLSPEKIVAGDLTQVNYSEVGEGAAGKKIFQFPLIVVRCRVRLGTKDGRRAVCDFRPQLEKKISGGEDLQVKKRGAYFSTADELAVFDILGFFRFAYRIPAERGALLVSPHAVSEALLVRAKGGETDRQDATTLERTDNLIDHRPYVPGDDPRRINWKLYSHGGELFVRQGEREPPPHSNITILIDTQYDSLYTAKTAPEAVDLLCESALAIINYAGLDTDVMIGFTDYNREQKKTSANRNLELGFSLAYPFALDVDGDLPSVSSERAIIILALPKINTDNSALDRFLSNNINRAIELVFIYGEDAKDAGEAAETCVSFFNRRSGVRAQAVAVQKRRDQLQRTRSYTEGREE